MIPREASINRLNYLMVRRLHAQGPLNETPDDNAFWMSTRAPQQESSRLTRELLLEACKHQRRPVRDSWVRYHARECIRRCSLQRPVVWIDDNDVASKRTFTFSLILSSLAETGQGAVVPVVTVPSRSLEN